MTTLDFGTRDTSLGGYLTSAGEVYSDIVDIPNGRTAANGQRPVKVYEIAAWVGARSGTISCRFELAGASTSAFTLGTSSEGAAASGYKAISKFYSGANANERFTIVGSGGFYFDRGGSGTTYGTFGNFSGALAGRLNYAQVPTAPGWAGSPISTPAPGQIAIDWVAPSDDGDSALTGYTIQYSTSSTFSSGVVTLEVTGGSRTITGLAAGTRYYFRVAARNDVADQYNTSGPYGSTISATTMNVPGAPTGLAVTPGVGQATLNWTAPSSNGGDAITHYELQYSLASNFSAPTTLNVGTDTSETVTGLTPGSTYYFRVRAVNDVGAGGWSNTVSTLTASVPGAPASASGSSGPGRVRIEWTAPADDGGAAVLDYTVEVLTDGTSTVVASATVPATARGRTLVGLTPGLTYDARVRARNVVGSGAWANVANVVVPARGALDVVDRAAVHLADGTQVSLRWSVDGSQILLGYSNLTAGVAWTSIAPLTIAGTASGFAHSRGLGDFALVAAPDDDVYVIGRRGDNINAVQVHRWSRDAGAWAFAGSNSQPLPSGADPLVQFAAAYVPGTGTVPVPTILLLARRAGSQGAGSLLYATLDVGTITPAGGTLFRAYGADPAFIAGAPSAAPDAGALDVAPLTPGATRLVIAANGHAVVDVSNGQVAGVAKAAEGSTYPSKARVLGISGTQFAVVNTRADGALVVTFYGTNGAQLGQYVSVAVNYYGGNAGRAWDAVYDRAINAVRVYRFAAASSTVLEAYTVSAATYLNSAAVAVATLGAGTYSQVRVPRGQVDERRVLVTAATGATLAAADDRQGNIAPTAPTLADRVDFDASQPATLAWAFGDTNAADRQTAYDLQVQRVSDSVNVVATGKYASSSQTHVIPGGILVNGTAYRWRVRTYDALDAAGTWSAYDAFSASALGTLTITDPPSDNPAGVDTASYVVAWTYAQAQGYTQAQRRVRLLRTSDGALVSDTTMQASTATAYTVTGMASDVQYTVEVSIVNTNGQTVTATRKITPSYAAPMTPELVVTASDHYVEVGINNPTPSGDRPEIQRNIVQRRVAGSADPWTTAGIVGHNGVLLDRGVRSATAYEYQVIGDTA